MSNTSWDSWTPYSDDKVLEIKVSMLDQIIADLEGVINNLENTDLFIKTREELTNGELDGKTIKAITEELATLKSNDGIYEAMGIEVENTITKVNIELAGIAVNIELLKKELNAYNHLWENYGTDTFDIEQYLAVKRLEVELGKSDIEIKIDGISQKGMELLRSWEYGSEGYYSMMIKTIDGSPFDINCQVPYDVGDGMATIGPEIAVRQNGDWKKSLNQKVADGLGTNINSIPVGEDGVCIPRATLDKSAEGLMNDEFIPHVLGGVDYYNEVTGLNLELTQIQLDAITSLYWNTGANILYYKDHGTGKGDYSRVTGINDVEEIEFLQEKTVEFYGNTDNANKCIESGELEKAEEELNNAFSSLYSNGNPDELQQERIDDTINYYLNNYYWETRFEIDDEK